MLAQLCAFAVALWLSRSLFHHRNLVQAFLDSVLSAISVVVAAGAYLHTGSLFMGFWCFGLVHALGPLIPSSTRTRATTTTTDGEFERAHNVAQAALRHLATR